MERILNTVGLGLLAVCFMLSLGRIAWKAFDRTGGESSRTIEIRLAHWQLEGGIREALDALAAEYTARHPQVRIKQIPIPERIYKNWLMTQLVGGTAPDIIQIGIGISDERLARFFLPLTELAEAPNPYNAGTDLEGAPLRETFFDGMVGGFNPTLLEFYGVPLSANTLRVYINLDLLHEVTGSEELPRTYRELLALCEKARAYGEKTGRPLIPLAGSRYNAPFLMANLFSSQTQKLVRELCPAGTFEATPQRLTETLAEGRWDLDTPAIRSGLKLMREVGAQMQPGFMQVNRDDAGFYFMQGKALMIGSGSWDASSISKQARFRFRAFRIPLPDPDDPEYGEFALGFTSEAGVNSGLSLGITNTSRHPEVAMDFLLFIASREMNQKFTDVSGWIPSVAGVRPSEKAKDFMMLTDGFTPGFALAYGSRPDTMRLFNNAFHRLVAPEGGVDDFVERLRPGLLAAHQSDLLRDIRNAQASLQRMDVQMAGMAELARLAPGDPKAAHRLDMMIASANMQERRFRNMRFVAGKVRDRIQHESY